MTEQTLLVADYAALEVVILADLCLRLFKDDKLAKSVLPGAPDIHSNNARYVYGEFLRWVVPPTILVDGKQVACPYAGRRVDEIPVEVFKKDPYGAHARGNIKTTFYGWCYGKRGYGFSTLLGADGKMIGEKVGSQLCDGLMAAMPGLGLWEGWVEAFVRKHNGIYSLGGRWCDLSDEMESDDEWRHQRAFRRALNFPCQASGADIIGTAMTAVVRCPLLAALGFRLCMQVHDELVMRGPLEYVEEAGELLRQHMVNATANGTRLVVPLQASVGHGPNYFEAK